MRLQLARAPMCPSDILLLDEPTNHLDPDAPGLAGSPGSSVPGHVDHDQPRPRVLDAITNVTPAHRQRQTGPLRRQLQPFEDMRAEQMALQQTSVAKQKKMASPAKFINRFKAKASKAKQAQSRVKALTCMEKIAPVLADAEFTFEFQEPPTCPTRCCR